MLADFLTWIWPALPAFFLAGVCFVIAGVIWLVAIRRHEVASDPQIPPVDEQATFVIPSPSPPPNYQRPRIPGATPELSPQLAAVARHLADVDAVAAETTHAIEGLRVIPSPKFATEPTPSPVRAQEETQEIDLCPLTTQDIEIPTFGETPEHRAIADREPTQELSGSLARAKERVA